MLRILGLDIISSLIYTTRELGHWCISMGFFLTDKQVAARLGDKSNLLSVEESENGKKEEVSDALEDTTVSGGLEGEESGEQRGLAAAKGLHRTDSDPSKSPDVFTRLKLEKIINNKTPGRKVKIRNRTLEENGSVGLANKILGSKETEKLFGVDPVQQNHLTHGFTGSVDRVKGKNKKEELLDEIYSQGGKVTQLAFTRILKSLSLLDEEKIEEVTDPMKLMGLARGLSGIVRDMTPKESDDKEQQVHFHVYKPEQKSDSDYETIEVSRDDYRSIEA